MIRLNNWLHSLSQAQKQELGRLLLDRTPAPVAKDWVEETGGVRTFWRCLQASETPAE